MPPAKRSAKKAPANKAPAKKAPAKKPAEPDQASDDTHSSQAVEPTKFICNVVPSHDTERDWSLNDAIAVGAIESVALPAAVDLRAPWWKINNQESTGSCVGWASADGVVRYRMTKARRIKQSEMLSPRHLWMASK